MVNALTWPHYPQERDAVLIVQESERVQGQVWMGAENLNPTFCYNVEDKK